MLSTADVHPLVPSGLLYRPMPHNHNAPGSHSILSLKLASAGGIFDDEEQQRDTTTTTNTALGSFKPMPPTEARPSNSNSN